MQPLAYKIKQILNRLDSLEDKQKTVIVVDNLNGGTSKTIDIEITSNCSILVLLPNAMYLISFVSNGHGIYSMSSEVKITEGSGGKQYSISKATEQNHFTFSIDAWQYATLIFNMKI